MSSENNSQFYSMPIAVSSADGPNQQEASQV